MRSAFNIVGIGEILWDVLPGGKRLGGAPANFAHVAHALGNRGIVLSRVGDDAAGKEILNELQDKNPATEFIQTDAENPTGTVNVGFENGQPRYEIGENAAWDFLESTGQWREIARNADAICFGSLAQRGAVSGATIRAVVDRAESWRVFDVNLRGRFFSPEILHNSLQRANVVKLNHEELPIVGGMFEINEQDPVKAARRLLSRFDLEMVCVTRGASGSFLATKNGFSENAGFEVVVADTVGAGEAFSAALADGLLRGWKLAAINEFANRVGAFVASQTGAMPDFPEDFTR